MFYYFLRRLIGVIPVSLGVLVIVSLMIYLVPGDPVDTLLGPYASDKDRLELRGQLGLDQPIPLLILRDVKRIFTLDLGESIINHQPVMEMIKVRIGPTVELAFLSMMVAMMISIPLGIIAALRAKTGTDFFAMTLAMLGVSMPNFWLGPLMIMLFSLKLGWLPVSERADLFSYVLPCITLGAALAAILSRMTRASVLENLQEDYVRTARAKGLSGRVVVLKHILRNASLPLLTMMGLQFGVLLTGAIITEKIFDWPGLGSLIISAIYSRDYPVVQGCVLLFSFSYVMVNLVTDILYAYFDPRIRLA